MWIRPGWGTLEKAASFQRWFETGGIFGILLSFVCAIGAARYSWRKEELTSELAARQSTARSEADHQLREEAERQARAAQMAAQAEADRKISEAQELAEARVAAVEAKSRMELASVDAKYAHRHLSKRQKQGLLAALSQHRGLQVEIQRPMGDAEAKEFSLEIRQVLESAGWEITNELDGNYSGVPVGLHVTVSKSLAIGDKNGTTISVPLDQIPKAAVVLLKALEDVGIRVTAGVHEHAPDIVGVLVGHKP
jgi:hypothetical protein